MRSEASKVEPESTNSLEYLQHIYRDPTQPTAVRMRAAIESLPFENAELSAVANSSIDPNSFARTLDRAIDRSNGARLIEGRAVVVEEDRR